MAPERGIIDERSLLGRFVSMVRRRAARRETCLSLIVMLMMTSPLLFSLLPSETRENNGQLPARTSGTSAPVVILSDVLGAKGQLLAIYAYVYDPDLDPMHVEFEFGDGSPNGTNDTPAFFIDFVIQEHVWYPPAIQGQGDYDVYYTLNVTATDTDGMSTTSSAPVTIHMPFNELPALNIAVPLNTVDPTDNVTIRANASDAEGEPLTWTYVFNDSYSDFLTIVNFTDWTAPGQLVYNNISYVFGVPGDYTVTVYVSDALPGYQVFPHNISQKSETIRVATNRLPYLGTITFTPSNTLIDAVAGFLDVTFSVNCLDQDGDPINLTWDFGDGTYAYNETVGGTEVFVFNQTKRYTEVASYFINATLTDGRPGHEILKNLTLNITGTNLPPTLSVEFKYASGDYAYPNETITFTINVTDSEGDPVELVIDFGDGSPLLYYNLTDYVDGMISITVEHSFSDIGQHNITMNYTDNRKGVGNHTLTTVLLIDVSVPPIVEKKVWTWWDYTGLGMFAMIPALVAARFILVARRRKLADEEGMSLEEWRLLQEQKKTQGQVEEKPEGE